MDKAWYMEGIFLAVFLWIVATLFAYFHEYWVSVLAGGLFILVIEVLLYAAQRDGK